MRVLAEFAASEAGKAFARIEERWGRDPAAALEEMDDVLAHNLRAALLMTLNEDREEVEDPVEKTRQAGKRMREQISG